MGKPSSLKSKSKTSLKDSKMEIRRLSNVQKTFLKKTGRQKLNRTITKVFKNLRENKKALSKISEGTISSNDSKCTTVINNKIQQKTDSDEMLVISDDEDCSIIAFSPNQSKQCSTPKPKSLTGMDMNHNHLTNNAKGTQDLNVETINLTKEINSDSYVTIDLADSKCTFTSDDVICIDDTVKSPDDTTFSVSDIGPVELVDDQTASQGAKGNLKKFGRGLLRKKAGVKDLKQQPQECEPLINYLNEVILRRSLSDNSVGSNIYHPNRKNINKTGLRMIVIDGSNVAVQHSRYKLFSVRGLKICIDFFLNRGHVVKAFVPRYRCKNGMSTDPKLLDALEKVGNVVYTPSREVDGKFITPYDDRYIIQCAAEFDGVIVSGDNYRDLIDENPTWRYIIKNRLLPFTWVEDMIMFPKDPLGRNGPTLDQFLRHDPPTK